MYTRYYDSYAGQSPKGTPAEKEVEESKDTDNTSDREPESEIAAISAPSFPGNIKADDLLLIALLFIIATESTDDFLMPLILGALLLG